MNRRLLPICRKSVLLFLAFCTTLSLTSQEYRSFDGTGNNELHPEWGAVGTNQLHFGTIGFADGMAEPSGVDRPNPRTISNAIFDQAGLIPDAMGLSDYAWVWGQFIDHDITLVVDHSSETMDIQVPAGDQFFDPTGTGTSIIGMHRSDYDPTTGTDPETPRAFPNAITSFIDASGVYGSDADKAAWLRTFDKGKLKMSSGQLLPYNTVTGEFEADIDPTAPFMAMPFPFVEKWFIAGDLRANENPLLTSVHTLFAREHNRLCDELAEEHPAWTDEELYQHARKMVGGIMQAIVYEEWLPTMGVHYEAYSGYHPDVNPGILNVFSAAAYRYGHTVINSEIVRMDNHGDIIPAGNILLRDAFFNPAVIVDGEGLEPLFTGMATQIEQEFDCKMIDDLRNFLFGPPGAGGLDLASLNINRGRDRGLADYNTVRSDFGLPRFQNFQELTDNPWLNDAMEDTYGDINNIDPWVGVLAEDHMSNTLFGETVMTIMIQQFMSLRDGDRFFFENDPGLSSEEIATIKTTTFADVIERNTETTDLQLNVFLAEPHGTTALTSIQLHPFQIQVFPNPTAGDFTFSAEVPHSTQGMVRITDQLGRHIQQQTIEMTQGQNQFELNLPNDVPAGIYHIGLIIDNQLDHTMLVKSGQ